MDTHMFHFSELDSTASFTGLSNSLGGKLTNNTIEIPPERGQGQVRKVDFEKGLHLRSWDFKLDHPFVFHRQPQNIDEAGKAYSLAYILSNESVTLDSPTLRKEVSLYGSMNILLISNDVPIDFKINAGQQVRAIDITISAEWMRSQFTDADALFQSFIDKMKNNTRPSVLSEIGTATEYKTAVDLHTHTFTGLKGTLYLKAKTLSLISDFLNRSFADNPAELTEGNVLHQEKMMMVEKLLDEHIEKNLPSIEEIAKQAALSESTLKRHFKLMFGKSIYEFYLEKKMDFAKKLLLEKPLTVKEVAYRLGYEKTSNFIHIFKKFHSYSPGYLKKNFAL